MPAYTLTVTNNGSQPTSGTVTLTETLPSGLTLSSMSGTGWNCAGATCTYSGTVAAGASFPPVVAAVVPSAVESVTNQVSASGGGSATANGTDPTNIVAATLNCLTVTVSPPMAGFNGASATSSSQCYNTPTLVEVTTYNTGGYTFSSFSGGLTGTTSPQTVMVSGTVNITANFATTLTLSPPNQNANLPIPANSSLVPATYQFSTGDPNCVSTCGVYDGSGDLSQYVTASITQRNASASGGRGHGGSVSVAYSALPGAVVPGQSAYFYPICNCFDGDCGPIAFPVVPVSAPLVTITGPQGIAQGGSDVFTITVTGPVLDDPVIITVGPSATIGGTGSAAIAGGAGSVSISTPQTLNLTVNGVQASSLANNIVIGANWGGELVASVGFSVV